VTQLDEFWSRKYGKDDDGRNVRIAETADVVDAGTATDVHLPSPSYWPLVVSLGLPLIGYGLIFNLAWAVPGVLLVLGGIYGWGLEPADDDENPPHHHPPAEALAAGDAPAQLGAGAETEEASGE
jgi:cytochrome c oxidase subunit 1